MQATSRKLLVVTFVAFGFATLLAAGSVAIGNDSRVLPDAFEFDSDIKSPSEFCGFPYGSRHWPHHMVVEYMQYLAEQSDLARWQPYARSHGGRPLGFLTITSESNWKSIGKIRQQHRALANPTQSAAIDLQSLPAVIQMGYGVHGDESSATHASVPVAYLLVAGRGEDVERWRQSMVIRIDPSLNPDGFDRFSNWVNQYRGKLPSADPLDREHRQPWPGGRVNYYWFDLNRDWLPAVHPESQGRLREYHRWKPNVVLDFHEMGTDSTYFFQPGVPKRTNPLSPVRTRELTRRFADYHAKALDAIDTLYFTEERFDDFYPGKGSTYPDLHGAVGILFEQGSARGNIQESVNGRVEFWKTIRNQVTTSISSLNATADLRMELLENTRKSYADAVQMAKRQTTRALAFAAPNDLPRLRRFAELLSQHDIQFSWATESPVVQTIDGEEIELPAWTLIVETEQPEYRMIRTMVERPTTFEENIFYDVSAWALPLAYDLQQWRLAHVPERTSEAARIEFGRGNLESDETVVAYAMPWGPENSARDLVNVHNAGLRPKVATSAFECETPEGRKSFSAGTVVVPIGIQDVPKQRIREILEKRCETTWYPVTSGLSPVGIDLGSGGFSTLESPEVLVVVGDGISRYDVGSIWHWFDTQLKLRVTIATDRDLRRADWNRYSVVILAGGSPTGLEGSALDNFKTWLSDGGTLISIGTSNAWAASQGWVKLASASTGESSVATNQGEEQSASNRPEQKPYASATDDRALELLSGVILEGQIDLTHPLGWGQADTLIPVFRNHKTFLAPASSPYNNAVIYAESPLMAGYASTTNIERIQSSVSVAVYPQGRGRVIAFAESPCFRGFFRGSARMLNNAIFFGPTIQSR